MSRLKGILKEEKKIEVSIIGAGPPGKTGSSAYQVWLDQGNEGTEQDFLDSLKSGGVSYDLLKNKPSINSVELIGNKELNEIGIGSISKEDISKLL